MTSTNQADRRDFDIAASQDAQGQFNAVANHLESLIDARQRDVDLAMANYEADGTSEAYRDKEIRWRSVAGEVKSIINTLRSSLASNDDSAAAALSRAKSAVDNIG